MNSYFISILTSSNTTNRLEAIKSTWLKTLDKNVYGIFSGDKINEVTKLECNDNYIGIKTKTLACMKYWLDNCNTKYFIKSDDDTYVDINSLNRFDNNNVDYIGIMREYNTSDSHQNYVNNYYRLQTKNKELTFDYRNKLDKNITTNLKFGAGAFYMLSRRIIKKIFDNIEDVNKNMSIVQEDIFIGYTVKMLQGSTMDISSGHELFDITVDNIAFHPVNRLLMRKFHKIKDYNLRIEFLEKYMFLNKHYNCRLVGSY